MTIIIKQTLSREINYPSLGVTSPGGNEVIDVTYSVTSIKNFDGDTVTAAFSVDIGGYQSRFPYEFTFKYSGSGNPLDEAESALAASLE